MTDFSYQLYSSRNFGPLAETLKMVSELGYAQVEGYGGLYADDAAVEVLKGHLAENGLSMPTGHVGFEMTRDMPQKVIEIANAVGMKAVIAPIAPGLDLDADGWRAFVKEFAEASKPILDAGLMYGFHNHHFEFMDKGLGVKPIELIMDGCPEAVLELDVAWVDRGGEDPIKWIAHYADRLIAAHVKDIAPEGECADEDGWADVGHGRMDWAAIMGALGQTNAKYFVMEHDNPSDDRRFASRSIAAARSF